MTIAEALESAQFVIGQDGRQTGVLLDIAAWDALVAWLEDMENRAIVWEALPRLRLGPERAGAVRWEDVAAEWGDDDAL